MTRKPNQGPYKVSCRDPATGKVAERECQTWAMACALMRELLIANYVNVCVEYC
jgi:hypothetical protein